MMNINLIYSIIFATALVYSHDPYVTLPLTGYIDNYKLNNNVISANTVLYGMYTNKSYHVDIRCDVKLTDIVLSHTLYEPYRFSNYFGITSTDNNEDIEVPPVKTEQLSRDIKLSVTVPYSYIHVDDDTCTITLEYRGYIWRLMSLVFLAGMFLSYKGLENSEYVKPYLIYLYDEVHNYVTNFYVSLMDHMHLVRY